MSDDRWYSFNIEEWYLFDLGEWHSVLDGDPGLDGWTDCSIWYAPDLVDLEELEELSIVEICLICGNPVESCVCNMPKMKKYPPGGDLSVTRGERMDYLRHLRESP